MLSQGIRNENKQFLNDEKSLNHFNKISYKCV